MLVCIVQCNWQFTNWDFKRVIIRKHISVNIDIIWLIWKQGLMEEDSFWYLHDDDDRKQNRIGIDSIYTNKLVFAVV